jgi:pyruvate/2-oxoglutarate dehydrogenase complex dihydrolipoamide acyltransferase (E2) component
MNAAPRIVASPYARRLARERGIPLTAIRGSGPSGRIVAADLDRPLPIASVAAPPAAQVAAVATRIDLVAMRGVLEWFAEAGMSFDLDDLVLRATSCALEDTEASSLVTRAPIAVEVSDQGRRWQIVLDDVRSGSLGPLRTRRLAALSGALDQSEVPAAISIRVLPASRVRPVMMPLLPDRAMRLLLAPDLTRTAGECLLTFDPWRVDEAVAARFLSQFQDYMEVPLRLLA